MGQARLPAATGPPPRGPPQRSLQVLHWAARVHVVVGQHQQHADAALLRLGQHVVEALRRDREAWRAVRPSWLR